MRHALQSKSCLRSKTASVMGVVDGGAASETTPTQSAWPAWYHPAYKPPPPSPPQAARRGDSSGDAEALDHAAPVTPRTTPAAGAVASPDSDARGRSPLATWAKADGTLWNSPASPACPSSSESFGTRVETPIRIRFPLLLMAQGYHPLPITDSEPTSLDSSPGRIITRL